MEEIMGLEPATAAIAGLGLSAAAGFRVFVPLLVLSIAGRYGTIPVTEEFAWVVSDPALLIFGVATAAEVASYYVPWVDNLLDTIATPAAVMSGTVITASVLPDINDTLQWGIAGLLGGGSAGVIQAGTVVTRGASSATSGGLGNPIVSTGEFIGAVVTSILACIIPIIVGVLVLTLLIYCIFKIVKRFRSKSVALEPEPESVEE